VVGIDLGLKSFSVQSDGWFVENPRYLNESQVKISRLQKHLSRKELVVTDGKKNKLRIDKEYLKVVNRRDWFLHNYSNYLVNNYNNICIEDLNVSSIMKNHKLAGSIGDVSLKKFVNILEYISEMVW